MSKSSEVVHETVCDSKHNFRKAGHHSKKPQKHRYERRKVRAYLLQADWSAE